MNLSAEDLADRFTDTGPTLTIAERAEHDRTWAYGHVVVDEAQELSPMAWRVLMRRCPLRSMTVVGDVAQTGSSSGARSWQEVLGPYVGDRWRLEELTVNYRTPAAIMDLASAVLSAAGVAVRAPESVREGDWPPVAERIAPGDDAAVAAVVKDELASGPGGRIAVIVPDDLHATLARELVGALPAETVGTGREALDRPVGVLTVRAVKGLEFDTVVLVEPGAILRGSSHGANDLYVAITRPTQRLRVLHSEPLPRGLERLVPEHRT